MASPQAGVVLRHLRALAAGHDDPTPDDQLLRRYVATHDGATFEALLRRHGPTVYGTAIKSVKGNPRDFPGFFRGREDPARPDFG